MSSFLKHDPDPYRFLSPAEIKAVEMESEYTKCRNALMRAMSNLVRGYRGCPLRDCRRARRCRGDSSHDCLTLVRRIPLSHEQQNNAIEDIYQAVRRRRRESRGRKESRG
jgi:hypothetical protein